MTQRLSENVAVVATIDPDAYSAAAYNSDAVDMANMDRVMFIVQVGTMASTSTVDFKLQGDTASGFSSPVDLTGKAITQLTEAGADSDKQAIVEVTGDEVLAQGLRYVRGVMTVATAASDAGVIALGQSLRYQPAENFDLASVDEIVA